MADDYGTCPNSIFDDERLEGAPLSSITGLVTLVMLADDHGVFDANSRVLARRLGCTAPEVSALLVDLEARGICQVYDCSDGERARRGGIIIGFHTYPGHPERVAFPSKRGASVLPFPDGTRVLPRRQRDGNDDDRGSPVEPPRKKRGSRVEAKPDASKPPSKLTREPKREGVAEAWQTRGSDVEAAWQVRGNEEGPPTNRNARAPEQHSIAEHSIAKHEPGPSRPPALMPSPAGSTDARARQGQQAPPASASSPPDADPVEPVASSPALGGAVEAPTEIGEPEPTFAWEVFPDGTSGLMQVEPPEPIVPVPAGARPCAQCGEPVDPGEECWTCAQRAADVLARREARAPPRLRVVGGEA